VASEAFADRRYEQDGSLRARKFRDALLDVPEKAAEQAVRIAEGRGALTREGNIEDNVLHRIVPPDRTGRYFCRTDSGRGRLFRLAHRAF